MMVNNQGPNAFNLDKYKANDPELEAYHERTKTATKIWYQNF